jgi:hypothetical protein
MELRLGLKCAFALWGTAALSVPANAAIDLRITEVWAGSDGSDITPDWVEITNFGDTAWNFGSSALTINDSGGGTGTDAVVQGIDDILPSEVAIVLMEGSTSDVQEFYDIWNPVKTQAIANIGFAEGSGLGLGQGGDGVHIWLDDVLEDSFSYTSITSDISYDVLLGGDSVVGNASGAVATLVVNDAGSPAVGSPGMVVPEPGAAFLLLLGVACLSCTVRRA